MCTCFTYTYIELTIESYGCIVRNNKNIKLQGKIKTGEPFQTAKSKSNTLQTSE